jgi:DNA repair protein RadD
LIKLRQYQIEAAQAAAESLTKVKKTLLVLPTASGKSLINAEIVRRAQAKGLRVLCLCAQAEILMQNQQAIHNLAPEIATSIYCAQLNQKDLSAAVVIASRDSFVRIKEPPKFDLIITDEAHMVSDNPKTSYGKIFAAVGAKYHVGLTGTPWRLGNGRIWGESGFYDEVAYNVSLNFLTDQGYLSPHKFPKLKTTIDTSNVRKNSRDFILSELEAVSSSAKVVGSCLDQWEALAGDRKCSIFFCCTRAHADAVASQLSQRLGDDKVGYIDGTFARKNREKFFTKARFGGYKALVNIGVLTTGVDFPLIDCAVLLRATMSASLFVQMCGRALRVKPGKDDCLILDMAGNFQRFESLDTPLIKESSGKGKKKPQILQPDAKKCPSCQAKIKLRARSCEYCGEFFISHSDQVFRELKSKVPVISHKHYKSETAKGEACWLLDFILEGNKRKRMWLLTSRAGWPGPVHRAMLGKLGKGYKIGWVKMDTKTKYENIVDFGWISPLEVPVV